MRHSTFFFFHTKSFKSGMNSTLTSHLTSEQINVKDTMAMYLVATRLSCTGPVRSLEKSAKETR